MANTDKQWAGDLAGKTALITGAGKGIGRASSLQLARCGAKVIAVSRTSADLESLQEESSGQIESWAMDITNPAFLDRVSRQEQLDILINNAGTNKPEPFLDVSQENLETVLNLNLKTAFLTAQAVAKIMKRGHGGSIIHMSSQMGHVGSANNRTVYCASKHAIEGLSKAMAVELAPFGIRSNTVAPTFVDTPMTRPMMEDADFRAFVHQRIPLGRMASIDEIANAVLFLASPASSMITGTSLRVDGGWTAH